MKPLELLLAILCVLPFAIPVFFLLRAFVCWYCKVNQCLALLLGLESKLGGLVQLVSVPDSEKLAEEGYVLLEKESGQAMCLGCQKIALRTGRYHNAASEVYYHEECLPPELRKLRPLPN